jgi:hypothetical protein
VQDLREPAATGTGAPPPVQPPPPRRAPVDVSRAESPVVSPVAIKKPRSRSLRLFLIWLAAAAGIVLIIFVITKFLLNGDGRDVNAMLRDASEETNRQCPMLVDRETRLDSTRILPGRTFQYNYTLIRTEAKAVDKQEFIERMEPAILDNVRKNPKLAWQRDNQVTMEYVYFDRTGRFLFNIRVTPKDY